MNVLYRHLDVNWKLGKLWKGVEKSLVPQLCTGLGSIFHRGLWKSHEVFAERGQGRVEIGVRLTHLLHVVDGIHHGGVML